MSAERKAEESAGAASGVSSMQNSRHPAHEAIGHVEADIVMGGSVAVTYEQRSPDHAGRFRERLREGLTFSIDDEGTRPKTLS